MKNDKQPQFSARIAAVNSSKTRARLTNGQIVNLHPKPHRNKAEMKRNKRARMAIRFPL